MLRTMTFREDIMAAGAASTPKMNSRVVLSIAKSRIGISDPYRP